MVLENNLTDHYLTRDKMTTMQQKDKYKTVNKTLERLNVDA